MRNRIITLMLGLFIAAGCATAQNLQFKLGGGLASHYGTSEAVGAFKVGVGYEIEFDQHWTFTPGLAIYGKGWKDPNQSVYVFDEKGNQLFDEETGEPIMGIMNRSATQNYLQLPLLFLLPAHRRIALCRPVPAPTWPTASQASKKPRATPNAPAPNAFITKKKTFNEPGTHRFDAGIQAMVGYQFPMGMTLGIEADFGLAKSQYRRPPQHLRSHLHRLQIVAFCPQQASRAMKLVNANLPL